MSCCEKLFKRRQRLDLQRLLAAENSVCAAPGEFCRFFLSLRQTLPSRNEQPCSSLNLDSCKDCGEKREGYNTARRSQHSPNYKGWPNTNRRAIHSGSRAAQLQCFGTNPRTTREPSGRPTPANLPTSAPPGSFLPRPPDTSHSLRRRSPWALRACNDRPGW